MDSLINVLLVCFAVGYAVAWVTVEVMYRKSGIFESYREQDARRKEYERLAREHYEAAMRRATNDAQ